MINLLIEQLADYDIDPVRGFLPPVDPLEQLPDAFARWERIASQLPALLMTHRLRPALDRLPALDPARLEDEKQRRRALLLLSIFANACVWAGDPPARRIPRGVAVPLCELAGHFDLPPIVVYASLMLYNWRRLDPNGPIDLDNLTTLQLFRGGIDEQWFYLVTLVIEAKGAPALPAMVEIQRAVVSDRPDLVAPQLHVVREAIGDATATLLRMPEQCDPYIFYHHIRRYLTGWEAPGVVYEGVSDEPRMCLGGSAAQSTLIQALDAGLGVQHPGEESGPFLRAMRAYMPRPHRRFVEALERGPSLRQFVIDRRQRYPVLRDAYNACVRALGEFRQKHIEIAVRYITRQAATKEEAKGTGGTNFAVFLGRARKETGEHEIV